MENFYDDKDLEFSMATDDDITNVEKILAMNKDEFANNKGDDDRGV